jgi:UDP-galactopyranose mutase
MPFALNDSTRFISPTKTPEYLAGGKPVVSTPITDVVRHYGELEGVRIAETPEEFVAAVEMALAKNRTQGEWLEPVDQLLAETSWDATWGQMAELIAKVGKPRSKPQAKRPLNGNRNGNGAYNGNSARNGNGTNGNGNGVHAQKPRVSRLDGMRRKTRDGFDYLIVGAGFAGSVLAERLASQAGKRVLLIDRRPHIGGNAYDYYNDAGVLIHRYGPHIFHTNSDKIADYLSQFTK